jgi:hypothetical protein
MTRGLPPVVEMVIEDHTEGCPKQPQREEDVKPRLRTTPRHQRHTPYPHPSSYGNARLVGFTPPLHPAIPGLNAVNTGRVFMTAL